MVFYGIRYYERGTVYDIIYGIVVAALVEFFEFYFRVIKLPALGGSNNTNVWVILREFFYNSALFGLVSYNDPCIWSSTSGTSIPPKEG